MGATETLARFVVETTADQISQKARDQTRRSLIDTIGTTLAGTTEPTAKIITNFVLGQKANPTAWVAGTTGRTSPMLAALANGTMAHALDFDDVLAFGHAGVAVVPAALAVAEEIGASGLDLLDAIVLGYEVAGRIAGGTTRVPYARGYHGTSIYGVFGATAAVGRLLRLDVQQMRHAFGIAGSLASGVRANFGTDTKPLHAGECGRQGVEASKLAQAGFTADPNIIETKVGYGETLLWKGEFDPEKMVQNLGKPFIAEQGPGLKKYACCYCNHATLDGMFNILANNQLDPAQIASITVDGSPMLKDPLIYTHPTIGLHGKFSLHYNIALAIVDGQTTLGSYTNDHIRDRRLAEVIDKVQVNTHEDWQPNLRVKIDIATKDGRRVVHEQDFIKGDNEHPLSWAEILEKFRDNASVTMSGGAIDRTVELIQTIESVASVRTLVAELSSGQREPALAL